MAPSDARITLKIDGHPYTLRPTDVTAWHSATFEAETGYTVEGMLASIDEPGGRTLTMIARFAYLAALVSGQEPRSFREVAERISYGSEIGQPEMFGVDDEADQADDETADEPELTISEPVAPSSRPTGDEPDPQSGLKLPSSGPATSETGPDGSSTDAEPF